MRHTISILVILNLMIQIKSEENESITTYKPEELILNIFNVNETIIPRQTIYGSIKFEDDYEYESGKPFHPFQPIKFEEQTRPETSFKFEDDPTVNNGDDILYGELANNHGFTFQDYNNIEDSQLSKQKQRRKPKNQNADTTHVFPNQYIKEPQRYPDYYQENKPHHPITFDEQTGSNTPFKFNDDTSPNFGGTSNIPQNNPRPQNDLKPEEPKPPKKKRRRRRRPRYQNQSFNQIQGYPGQYPVVPQGYPVPYPGNAPQRYQVQESNGAQGYLSNQGYPGQFPSNPQGFPGQYPYPADPNGQYYRPPRRPKQSLASEALSAVTGALTSIALYDDYECVPRLLCEAAGGGALGSSSVLQNVAGLQPLLTLLAAYNGISSSPLFIFGRAVFLGMTAKGNVGTCRYAYPQCPNDPEQLVHYLNNHNGGFFRFFNSPQLNSPPYGQQNVEQFYNQLSQNYGLYQQGHDQLGNQQNYGIYQPTIPNQQNYGIYQPTIPSQENNGIYPPNFSPTQVNNPNLQTNIHGYGLSGANLYDNRPYNYGIQNYGAIYPYQNNYGFNRLKSNNNHEKQHKIEKRIINGKGDYFSSPVDINDNPKWVSSEYTQNSKDYDNYRGGKGLKFPDDENQKKFTSAVTPDYNIRAGKGFTFPDNHNNIKYVNYYISPSTTPASNGYGFFQNKYHVENDIPNDRYKNTYNYDSNNNKYNIRNQNYNLQNSNEEGVNTVYVVRGNGDPNHPEIVKLKPGQILQ